MEVSRDPVNGVQFASGTSGQLTNGTSLAETFDNFLVLLTTQLQHQDPLSPMDTTQFTEQLVQFTGVEQALATNKKLDELISLQTRNQLNQAAAYIGKDVTSSNIVLMLQGGSADISYTLSASAADANILVIDENGNTVRTLPGPTGAGTHEITWDGKNDEGNQLDDAVYGFLVSAVDVDGNNVPLNQQFTGTVTGIKQVDDEIVLSVGDVELTLDEITGIKIPDDEVQGV